MTETHSGHNPKLATQKIIGFHEMLQHEIRAAASCPAMRCAELLSAQWHSFRRILYLGNDFNQHTLSSAGQIQCLVGTHFSSFI
jgi:hypothetical protein